MAERVRVLKRETTATGGDASDEDDLPSPIDPNEDFLDARGLALQGATSADETVTATRDASDNMVLKDPVAGTWTLYDLANQGAANFHSAASDGLATTTSSSYVDRTTLTTASVPAGTYMVAFYAEVGTTQANKLFAADVTVDGTTQAETILRVDQISSVSSFAGFKVVTFAVPAVHTIKIRYKVLVSATAEISRARLAFWRLA